MSTAPLDYDRLMQANLARVFGERDALESRTTERPRGRHRNRCRTF